jgi:hypothetical protein
VVAEPGELAIEALADFGLMEIINTRFGRWTEAGKKFICGNRIGPAVDSLAGTPSRVPR